MKRCRLSPNSFAVVLIASFSLGVTAQGQSLTVLHDFVQTDGAFPEGNLVVGPGGAFYGTTGAGGAFSYGTVFKMTTAGVLTTLHSFGGPPDGAEPKAGLTRGTDGNFYGTTALGGTSNQGTIFRITPTGGFSLLHAFGGADGTVPTTPLTLGHDGNLYGVTSSGGAAGHGTFFKITPGGSFTGLYSFGADNGAPSGLTVDHAGNFWGIARGAVPLFFEISPSGVFSSIYTFTRTATVLVPLTLGGDGNFYGTTLNGGTSNAGSVFQITPAGVFTQLYVFTPPSPGYYPRAALTLGADGNFYGTASAGGAWNSGTAFEITPAGAFTLLYTFAPVEGVQPYGGLTLGTDGSFYGTTSSGGTTTTAASPGAGLVFRLTPCSVGSQVCSSTALESSPNPAIFGNSVNFTATVTPASGTGSPTGTVTFFGYGSLIGTALLSDGIASFSTTASLLTNGLITASYSGDANFKPSSWALSQNLSPEEATVTLTSTVNPSIYYEPVTLNATVSPLAGSAVCTGTVNFLDSAVVLGTAALASGIASFSTQSLSLGKHSLSATYIEDGSCAANAFQPITQVVNETPTTITIFSSANPATVNQPVAFEATISAQYGGQPGGKVVFFQNGARIGPPIALTWASAVFTTSFASAGTYAITAAYTGDGRYLSSSTPNALHESVN